MSIHSLIETSRRSFRTLDGLMNTAGQNVANAETEGYARRRITLQADNTVSSGTQTRHTSLTPNGIGVSIATYERVRDTLLQRSAWTNLGGLGAAEEEHRVLGALEGLFPSGGGSLEETLNRFWNAWSDLSDAPTSDSARIAVQSAGEGLTTTFNRLDADLRTLEEETLTLLGGRVEEANGLLKSIAELNATIRTARHTGTPDYAAEDRRDAAVADLARLLPVRVETGADYTLSVGGVTVIEGAAADQITLGGAPPTLTFENAQLPLRTGGEDGAVGALFRTLTTAFPETRAELDAIANALVMDVNALHEPRFDDGGAPVLPDAPPFFDPAGTTAATFSLSPAVAADAGLVGTPGFFTAAGEEVAFAIAGLRSATLTGLSGSSEHAAIDLAAGVGARVQSAASRSTSQGAVAEHLEAMERGISAVSIDDELASLIRYQQAFGAAARVLSTAQDMMDTLLAL